MFKSFIQSYTIGIRDGKFISIPVNAHPIKDGVYKIDNIKVLAVQNNCTVLFFDCDDGEELGLKSVVINGIVRSHNKDSCDMLILDLKNAQSNHR